MRADARRPLALALLLVALAARSAGAHALSPALLMLQEDAAGDVAVTWKIPTLRLIGAELRPILPAECPVTQREEISEGEDSVTTRWRIACGSQGLVGRKVGIEGLAAAKTDALVRLELADGRAVDTVLRARASELVVPAHERGLGLAGRYVTLGVEHILTGYDHLLFVFGLLLLASGARALVATITAFTLGHSVTLTLAVLDIARVPSGPVEVLIAFSIFVLAVELARRDPTDPARRERRGAPTRMQRRPWLMALAFGFLHGLGFAGTLRTAGLPQPAIPLALFGFNVGIELGQLAFVVAVLGLTALARPAVRRLPVWTHTLPVYAMGSLAACWMIQRLVPLLR